MKDRRGRGSWSGAESGAAAGAAAAGRAAAGGDVGAGAADSDPVWDFERPVVAGLGDGTTAAGGLPAAGSAPSPVRVPAEVVTVSAVDLAGFAPARAAPAPVDRFLSVSA